MISLISFLFYTVFIVVSSEENIFSSTKRSLNFSNNRNIILVVGNSGSEKSTLIHYVAGDLRKLTSIKSSNLNDLDHIIQYESNAQNDGSTWSTVLQTFVPETVIDEQQNIWYDYTDFTEINNQTVEIVNAVLMKSVIQNASNIKIVMVVNYESVKEGQSHRDFDNLLTNTTKFIKRVKKFEDSLSLVVTKAPSYYDHSEISVENVKKITAEFMKEHSKHLKQNEMANDKILLIEALLKRSEEETYPKISVFQKPDKVGQLSGIEKIVKGRELIRKSILENTIYAQIQSNDFKFPLSDDAIEHIHTMIDEAVDTQVKNISDRIKNVVNQTIQSLHGFKTKLEIVHIGQSKIENYKNIDGFNLQNLTELFGELIKEIGSQSIEKHEFSQIEREENYLNILKWFGDRYPYYATYDPGSILYKNDSIKIKLNEISNFFNKCESDIKINIENEISQLMNNISISQKNIDQQLLAALHEKLHKMNDIYDKLNLLQIAKESIESIDNATTLEQRIKQFSTLILNLNTSLIDISALHGALNQTEKDGLHVNELASLSKPSTVIPVEKWIENLSNTIKFIQKCESDIQKDIEIEIPKIINNISVALTNVDQQLLAALQEKLKETEGYHNKLNLLYIGLRSINSVFDATTLEQRIKLFSTLILNLNVTSIDKSVLSQIEKDSLYLNELVTLLKYPIVIPVEKWIANSSSTIEFMQKCENDIQSDIANKISNIINKISDSLTNIDMQILAAFQETPKNNDIHYKFNLLRSAKKSIESIGNATTLEQRTKQFSTLILNLNTTSINISALHGALNQIEKNGLHVNELVTLSKPSTVIPVEKWIAISSNAIKFLQTWENYILKDIEKEISQIIKSIPAALINIDQQLLAELQERLEKSSDIHDKLNLLRIAKESIELIGNAITLEQRTKQFSNLIQKMNVKSIDKIRLTKIEKDGLYLNDLASLSKSKVVIPVKNWIANSSRAINFVFSEHFYLLGHKNATDLLNEKKWTPLHDAAINGNKDDADLLIKRGANVNAEDGNKHTPLRVTAKYGNGNVANLLINHGAIIATKGCDEWTPLHEATFNGFKDVAYLLINNGADVNAETKDKWTPLHAAAKKGYKKIADILIKHGAQVNAETENNCTPLYEAAQNGHKDVADLLINAGAKVNAENRDKWTPLHEAVKYGFKDVADLLINAGANVNATNINGWTPLHIAAQNNRTDVADFLINRGADINAEGGDKWTPLHAAAQNGFEDFAHFLIKRGAKVDANTNYNWTPLHIAAQNGKKDVIEILVRYGAEIDAKNRDGNTPLDVATEDVRSVIQKA